MLSDLIVLVLVLHTVWHALIRPEFIRRWVRQNMWAASFLSVGLVSAGVHSLKSTVSPHMAEWVDALAALLQGKPSTRGVIGAFTFLTLGLAVGLAVVWCWFLVPREPDSFSDAAEALRFFITGQPAGLDWAVLLKTKPGDDAQVEANWQTAAEAPNPAQVEAALARLGLAERTVAEQVRQWAIAARVLVASLLAESPKAVAAGQGEVLGVTIKVDEGALFIEALRGSDHPLGGQFVFAASLSRDAVASGKAQLQFNRLVKALAS